MSFIAGQFSRCRPWLEAALGHSTGCWAIADVEDALLKGEAQIWPSPNACAVTVIEDTPQAKVLKFWLAGGDLDELLVTEECAVDWAKRAGCSKAVIVGRDGWLKRLKGYRKVAVIMAKDI